MALGKRESVRIHYSGNVQGVGFRYTVKNVAMGYEVTGQVRNLADGRVELVVEGDREELTAFLQAVRDSGPGSLHSSRGCLLECGGRLLQGL